MGKDFNHIMWLHSQVMTGTQELTKSIALLKMKQQQHDPVETDKLALAHGRSLWPGVGYLNYLAVPGDRDIRLFFMPVTTNHFPGWGISVIFDLTFFAQGKEILHQFFFKKRSNPHPIQRPPPTRLHIDS